MEISLPLPKPTTDAERAEVASYLHRAARAINNNLQTPTNDVTVANLGPLISELERFFAGHEPPSEVLKLVAWYHGR